MKKSTAMAATFATALMALGPAAFAQHGYDRDHHGPDRPGFVQHNEWRRGYRMPRNDWSRGRRVDYRAYRLPPPRRGYEWREVDGNYVMAAVATGLIASVVANAATR